MIKVGPERDKVIAELRGELCHHPKIKEVGCKVEKPIARICEDECKCLFYHIKPYSTSIVHAMELWEEMPTGTQLSKNPNGATVRVKHGHHYKDYIVYKGDTEADAISGAYLKWKQ